MNLIPIEDALRIAPSLPETANSWPWLAACGVLLVLAAIALGGRRQLPFGER